MKKLGQRKVNSSKVSEQTRAKPGSLAPECSLLTTMLSAPADELQLPRSLPAASLQLPHLSYNRCEELVGKPVSVISITDNVHQPCNEKRMQQESVPNSASGRIS